MFARQYLLVERQIQMLNSRPQLNYDLDPEPTEVDIHLLSNASQNVTPSATPLVLSLILIWFNLLLLR